MRVNRASGIPLYVQIREIVRGELGHTRAGTSLPTEVELGSRFGVSLITVRRAMGELVAEGLLVRKQGKGTFVAKPKLTHELNAITSWTEQLRALGYTPGTSHREVREVVPDRGIAQLLGLDEGSPAVIMKRLRLADDEPVSLMTNYIPSRLVPGFTDSPQAGESLYEMLEDRYGLIPANAQDTVETRPASPEEAALLQIKPRAPILQVTRVSYLDDGTALEAAIVASRGDRYQYRVNLRGRPRSARLGAESVLQSQRESVS